MHIGKRAVSAAAALCMTAISFAAMPGVTADAAESQIFGDVNADGVVDIGDVICLSKYLNGMLPTSSLNVKYSDVDKNAVIDVNDNKTIMNYLIGSVEKLPYSESGSQFNPYYFSVPDEINRDYIEYDCSTKTTKNYTLSAVEAVSATSGDVDDRIIDSSNNAQCIVRLESKRKDGSGLLGTGFIISDHVIVTAAHCVYYHSAFNTNCTVTIYNTAGTSPIATYPAKEVHIPLGYARPVTVNEVNNDNYDYALIYVEEDLSAYGKMALGVTSNHFSGTSQRVFASGFPDEAHEVVTTYRYYSTGNITSRVPTHVAEPNAAEHRLFSTAYISYGDSGGPLYIEYTLNGSTFRSAIGINITTHSMDSLYGATRITPALLHFYNNNPNIG